MTFFTFVRVFTNDSYLQQKANNTMRTLALACFVLVICAVFSQAIAQANAQEASLTQYTSKDCQSCHQAQHLSWSASHHAKAMQVANSETVLGDFGNTQAKHFSQEATFFIIDERYFAKVKDDRSEQTYEVRYTFGIEPLQQYLVLTGKGHYQVLPFAWDTREKEDGGQRWMHLYPNEDIPFNDRLHWQQPLQNWNGMCADCHSDGLKRHYNPNTQSFATTYTEINVGCLACHDDKTQAHNKEHRAGSTAVEHEANKTGFWRRLPDEDVATWIGQERKQAKAHEQTCYACHSLRSPLTDGFDSTSAYLDSFSPNLIMPPLYFPDGQIKEEVYVMGSFLQSKMHQKGVTCIDCHDPHSYQLKAEGNGTCLQCHSPQVFETPKHHGHPLGKEGSMCVDCHMPKTTYMNVDARGDHSFKIPRPEFTISAGVPNACNQCHEDKSAEWALETINTLHPDRTGPSASEQLFLNVMHGIQNQDVNLQQTLELAMDTSVAEIRRASALSLLQYAPRLNAGILQPFVDDDSALLRLAAAQVSLNISTDERGRIIAPLLNDPFKAVRVAAAYALLDVSVSPSWQDAFESAFNELEISQSQGAWRGEGLMQQGISAQRLAQAMSHGMTQKTIQNGLSLKFKPENVRKKEEEAYKLSIYIDPYFAPAYINLTELYRQQGRAREAQEVFERGLENIGDSGTFRYAYALFFVREQAIDAAYEQIQAALTLEPENAQFAYLFYLVLERMGKRSEAQAHLRKHIARYQNNQQLKALLQKWGG
uniref:ammonia-forming cytochrome c nitrite reductase subunit c552 n=1 Tax=Ningiella ruwaisensis TaxID=2364274 RepID=UPI00109EE4C5|nr:ammonia-forming cytochrome c nitrite reductase subunit c552 [Ningiella ruwaisensis]